MPSSEATHAAPTATRPAASAVAETSRGPVEFARVGEPPYILFFHGSPGGYDQGVSNDDFAGAVFGTTLRVESTFDKRERRRIAAEMANSPEKLRRLREMSAGASPMKERMAGFENDLARFAAIEQPPLEEIRCPTLICHGTCDGDVPFAHAEAAHRLIPDARLHRMENGWHLLWLCDGADEMIRTQLEFVQEHSQTPAS